MVRQTKVSIKNNAVVISQKTDDSAEYSDIAFLHKSFLFNAVAFTKAEEIRQVLSDSLLSLRIAKDECLEPKVTEPLTQQINALSKLLDGLLDTYTHNKAQIVAAAPAH